MGMMWQDPQYQIVRRIAELMVKNGKVVKTLSEACSELGCSPKNFGPWSARLLRDPSMRNALGSALRAAINTARVSAGFDAIAEAGGAGLAAFTSLAWGSIILWALIGGGIVVGAIGYHYYSTVGKTVQLGSRFASPVSTAVQAPGAQGAGPYYIFVLHIEPGGSIYVGGKTDVQRPSCQFTDGGLCHGGDPNVQVDATIGGSYETYDQAVAAYCQEIQKVYTDPFGGVHGTINGKEYWLDNAPSC